MNSNTTLGASEARFAFGKVARPEGFEPPTY